MSPGPVLVKWSIRKLTASGLTGLGDRRPGSREVAHAGSGWTIEIDLAPARYQE